MTFSSYPEYKSSGHEWVGEIPSHWLIYRSKNIFSERNVKALESDEQLTASQKYGVIPQKLFSALEDQKVMQVITSSAYPGAVISMRMTYDEAAKVVAVIASATSETGTVPVTGAGVRLLAMRYFGHMQVDEEKLTDNSSSDPSELRSALSSKTFLKRFSAQ